MARQLDPGDGFYGNAGYGRANAPQLSLKPDIPLTTHDVLGIDLTHTIGRAEFAAAKGGPGGGGSGGGTTSSFAPYTAGPVNAAAGYNITVEFKGTWTTDYYNVFKGAADRLAHVIVGELPNVTVVGKGGQKVVDDILITAELGNIDGLYGVLGQAGPTALRTNGSLPATAQMKFDIVDVNDMGLADFTYVVLHEMSHSLGFGSIWGRLGLVTNGVFTGSQAVAQYHAMGGDALGIAVEQDGGSGTAGSHWDEETFANELMTGYLDSGTNYLTAMSAASFGDLGYQLAADYQSYTDTGYLLTA